MSFVQRALGFSFTLGKGSFGNSGANTVTLPSGLWATANIEKYGVPSMNKATIQIFGMSGSLMNELSTIGILSTAVRKNIVTITAGEAGGAMSTVFAGYIKAAWPDFSNPTEAAFKVDAYTGLLAQMKPVLPTSFNGTTDVSTIMGNLAKQMGYTLENNGVSVQLTNPYLPGTARMQALAAADAAGIYVVFDDDNGVMAILPKTSARGGAAPVISPLEQMVGYPTYVGPGQIALTTEYNPQIRFMGNVNVKNSVISRANGTWRVTSLVHDLSTMPEGPWFSHVKGNNLYQAQGA